MTSVRRNGIDHGQGQGVQFGASAIDSNAAGYWVPIHEAPTGLELNTDFSVAYFSFDEGWIAGHAKVGVDDGPLSFLNATEGIRLNPTLSEYGLTEEGFGAYNLRLPGVDAVGDGVLLVNGGANEANYALSRANADGSWSIFVHDLGLNAASYEPGSLAFVYVPNGLQNVVSGRIAGDGTKLSSSGNFSILYGGNGTHRLRIQGHNPQSGVLLVSAQGNGVNIDNIVSYQSDGQDWLIQSRDLPSHPPTLQSSGNEAAFSFAFFPAFLDRFPSVTEVNDLILVSARKLTLAKQRAGRKLRRRCES
jgi:hypothetical protein